MAIIEQMSLNFNWKNIEEMGDLEKLSVVFESLPDEELLEKLDKARGRRKGKFSVRYLWHLYIAKLILGHEHTTSLLREAGRNLGLLVVCGAPNLHLDINKHKDKIVPDKKHMYRFYKLLARFQGEVEEMIYKMIEILCREITDFGKILAVDSTVMESYGKPVKGGIKEGEKKDGRREYDARWGKKEYEDENGNVKEIVFCGFKLHLVVDAEYEIPLAFTVTPGNVNDTTQLSTLFSKLKENVPEIIEKARVAVCDRGYDSRRNNEILYDEYDIIPVIQNRKMWREEEEKILDDNKVDNILYREDGRVICVCPVTGDEKDMVFTGFEKGRKSLKYRCPAREYGISCEGLCVCEKEHGVKGKTGRSIRIKLEKDPRIFTPIPRHTNRFKELLKKRSSVERVNSRLKELFSLTKYSMRGLENIRLHATLCILAMVAIAYARLKNNDLENIRSLYQPLKRVA